ncbi:MAG: Gldg family protein [Candidatus Aminicenantes bacterium]|nr:Gldg family protein [Candidatus Aminicenantes bacterium]
MTSLKKNLNTIALTLIAAAVVGGIVWPQKKTLVVAIGTLGLLALAAHIAFNLKSLKQSFRRKSFIYSGNLLLVVVLVMAILGLVNYFLSKNHYRMDFTTAKLHSLSGQSVTVLKNLKTDIAFKCFFREGNYGRAAMENLLKIYAYHSGKVKYEFIDPDKNPGLVKRYGVTQDGTTVIEAGDKESRITTTTEEDVTNALIKATRAAKKVIYFLEGHGEESVEEAGDNGYATVKTELEKLGYEVKKQALALADRFPKVCALLVVPGPQKDLLPNEYETIRTYLKDGGRVLFMVDPETATTLPFFLAEYGFRLENDIVVDTVSRLLGGDYFMPVVSEYETHAITDKFTYATFFPFARSVEIAEPKPEGVTLTVLAKTSPNSWSERQLNQKEVKFTPDKDKQGPVGLAAVATFKTKAAEASPAPIEAKPGQPAAEESKAKTGAAEKEARMAVVGDSDFAKNRYYGVSGNGNFFLNIANWLTEESDLIAIQPKTQTPRTIQLTPSQGRLLFLVSVIILPLAVLLLGVSVWVRRRSL